MQLQQISHIAKRREGGIVRLAKDAGMSKANLYRCIHENKMQASDLEKIARVLKCDILLFFDDDIAKLSSHED